MAKNSLFAILLRSPWWISLAIGAVLALLSLALLPEDLKVVGALSATPFIVVGVLAARRQWHLPSAAEVSALNERLALMGWGEFSALLEQAFQRDGHAVRPVRGGVVDFELERSGRKMVVSARRWKSARTGLETLRALQAAGEAAEAADALYVVLGELSDNARPFAAEHRIAVWGAAELAQALKGVRPTSPARR